LDKKSERPDFSSHITKIANFFRRASGSGFLFCACNLRALVRAINRRVAERAAQTGMRIGETDLVSCHSGGFLTEMRDAARERPDGLIISNLDQMIRHTRGEIVTEMNVGREILTDMGLPVVFWLSEKNIPLFANRAPDLFSRRDRSVLCFSDKRLEKFYTDDEDPEDYGNLKLKITLLEKQLEVVENNGDQAKRIAADLISLYLKAGLYEPADVMFEAYRGMSDEVSPHISSIFSRRR